MFRFCIFALLFATCIAARAAEEGGGDAGSTGQPEAAPAEGTDAATAGEEGVGPGGGADDAPAPKRKDRTQDGARPAQPNWMLWIALPLLLMVFLFWSQSRAQKKEKQKRETMLQGLTVGAEVVTVGGIHGKLVRKGEHTVDVQVGTDEGNVITFELEAIRRGAGGDGEDKGRDA